MRSLPTRSALATAGEVVAWLGGYSEDIGQDGRQACRDQGCGASAVAKGWTCGFSLSRRHCRPANQLFSLALVLLLFRHVMLSLISISLFDYD